MTSSNYFLAHLWLIPLFPLITAALMLFFGRLLSKSVINFFCVGSVLLSFIHALGAVLALLEFDPAHRVFQQILFEWVTPGPMPAAGGPIQMVADWGYLLDPLSCVMILVVTGVGFLIHVYSIGYMAHEGGYYRFFGYMNLFMFSMLTLVLANNLLLLFVGWEGVGLCSYLLIGFYFLKKSASDAGKKAFIVNRVGDTGFLLGIFLIATTFGTIRFTSHGLGDPIAYAGINETLAAMLSQDRLVIGGSILTAIALLLFVGAVGKSAQLPLYVWLPDAMEGPTPVSALIHAATMVTAGVYMVVRMNAIYQLAPLAMDVVAMVGALTAIFAATIALAQTDIKKVLAYSTISQLGYMFLALGVGAFSAGIFHLMTHAFFKALLFLGAGSVIHALSGEQDLRKMGGLWNTIPATSRPFLIATLAIAGMPPLAGFFSKDEILGHAFGRAVSVDRYLSLWIVGVVTAGLTAFYMFRLLFLAFFGYSRVSPQLEHHIHESPKTMTVPLAILAGLSIVGGWFALPSLWGKASSFEEFLEPVVSGVVPETVAVKFAHHTLLMEWFLMAISVSIAGLGIWFAYDFYLKHPQLHSKIAARWPRLHDLLVHKYYVDELYDALFVNRVKDLSTAFGLFDAKVIDGLGVDGAGWLARMLSRISMWWDKWIVDGLVNLTGKFVRSLSYPVRMIQTGVFSSYAVFILIGLAILLAYYGHHMQVLMRNLR
ncbi:MAG: NADH-quinone oxidoreductase subunit L [Candidatus Acidiferrum sp.]